MSMLEKCGLNENMIKLVAKFRPDVQELIDLINDPDKLHNTIFVMTEGMRTVLEEDHGNGYGGEGRCACFSIDIAKTGEEGSQSVSSGNDRQWKVDTNGSVDKELSGILRNEEVASTNTDSGHEAQVQSGTGAKWDINEIDW